MVVMAWERLCAWTRSVESGPALHTSISACKSKRALNSRHIMRTGRALLRRLWLFPRLHATQLYGHGTHSYHASPPASTNGLKDLSSLRLSTQGFLLCGPMSGFTSALIQRPSRQQPHFRSLPPTCLDIYGPPLFPSSTHSTPATFPSSSCPTTLGAVWLFFDVRG